MTAAAIALALGGAVGCLVVAAALLRSPRPARPKTTLRPAYGDPCPMWLRWHLLDDLTADVVRRAFVAQRPRENRPGYSMVAFAEWLDIRVVFTSKAEAAAQTSENPLYPTIYIPSEWSIVEKRSAIAHMVSSYVLYGKPCEAINRFENPQEIIDVVRFACSLLVPVNWLLSLGGSGHHSVSTLARAFEVSDLMMRYQMRRFGVM